MLPSVDYFSHYIYCHTTECIYVYYIEVVVIVFDPMSIKFFILTMTIFWINCVLSLYHQDEKDRARFAVEVLGAGNGSSNGNNSDSNSNSHNNNSGGDAVRNTFKMGELTLAQLQNLTLSPPSSSSTPYTASNGKTVSSSIAGGEGGDIGIRDSFIRGVPVDPINLLSGKDSFSDRGGGGVGSGKGLDGLKGSGKGGGGGGSSDRDSDCGSVYSSFTSPLLLQQQQQLSETALPPSLPGISGKAMTTSSGITYGYPSNSSSSFPCSSAYSVNNSSNNSGSNSGSGSGVAGNNISSGNNNGNNNSNSNSNGNNSNNNSNKGCSSSNGNGAVKSLAALARSGQLELSHSGNSSLFDIEVL
jgi:hypothetical protein